MLEPSTIRDGDSNNNMHTELILKRLVLLCIAITAGISCLAIIGWMLNLLFLAQIFPSYIPMAQSTTLSFAVLCFALFVYARKPEYFMYMTFARIMVFLVLIFNLIIFFDFLTGAGFDIEQLIYPQPKKFGGVLIGRMSPLTAAIFLLSACALLLLLIFPQGRHRARSTASFLAFIVVSAGLVMVLGYLYGTPLLYGGTIIPVALNTAIAFMFIGTGFIAAAGQHYFPVSLFAGSSLYARLMRALIPFTIAIILINGCLNIYIFPLTGSNVLASSLTAILSIIIVSIIISKMVHIIDRNIIHTDVKRKQAEKALRESEEKFRIITSSLDITERRKAEETLRLNSEIMKNVSEGIYLIRFKDGIIVFTNPKFENMFGYEPGEMIGKNVAIVNAPSDKTPEETKNNIIDILIKTGEWHGEVENIRKNGTHFWCYANVSLFDHPDFGSVIVSVHTDITERKLAEEELKKYREQLEDIVKKRTASLTEKTEQLTANQAVLMNLVEELNGTTAELVKARDRAESADRLKSIFLATMSHELRTPLNSIIGFTGLMLSGFSGAINDEQIKQLNMVKLSANHLLALINDILDISKIEAGQLNLDKSPLKISEAIKSVVQIVSPLAKNKKLPLYVNVSPDEGVIHGDKRRVEQILFNLLSNAIKFTNEGEIRVECYASDGEIITRVIDTGIGIKPEHMSNLFKPFIQVDNGISRRYEGTGLGLSISKRLVEMMGGSIRAESEYGKGSVFTFTLHQLEGEAPCDRPEK